MRTWLDGAFGRTGAKAPDSPRVFTVPPGRPFLTSVARAILSGDLPATGGSAPPALELPDVTLLLPTRRAARAMQEAFLVANGGRAMLLPRIRPISEAEEELNLLSGLAAETALGPEELELAPAVSEIERRIALTMLVGKWSQSKRPAGAHSAGEMAPVAGAAGDTPAKAANLAADLCRLMDMVETEGVDFAGLAQLVPEEFSEHWQQTIEFLKIITEAWPAHLAERGLLSPVGRRNRAILAEAKRLADAAPAGPVIVAGVTGLYSRHRRADANGRAPTQGRDRAAGPRSQPRRGELANDRSRAPRAPAVRSQEAARPPRSHTRGCARACGQQSNRIRHGPRGADGGGDAAVRNHGQMVRLYQARRPQEAAGRARRRQPNRSSHRTGRSRGRGAHSARGGRDSGPYRGTHLARPIARAPRRHSA